jgi:hypothetical protein
MVSIRIGLFGPKAVSLARFWLQPPAAKIELDGEFPIVLPSLRF